MNVDQDLFSAYAFYAGVVTLKMLGLAAHPLKVLGLVAHPLSWQLATLCACPLSTL